MSPWIEGPAEERNLLNPGFCAAVLWHAATGYQTQASATDDGYRIGLPFELAFLVLPFVLRGETRRALPMTVRTSLAVWIEGNPIQRSSVGSAALTLVPFTREAILFGVRLGAYELREQKLVPRPELKKGISAERKSTTNEVKECFSRAEFVGRWLFENGAPSTIMAVIGVRA